MDDLKQDPHIAYSRVSVHVTYKEVLLTGTVLTQTAKEPGCSDCLGARRQAEITDRIKVNSNTHPGPGF